MTKIITASSRDSRQSPTSGPLAPRQCFTKGHRLLTASEFSIIFKNAPLRASHPNLLILARPTNGNTPRLGLVVAKKHIKKAVNRNLFKRVTRESFRLQQHNLAPIDAIVLARRGADTLSAKELRHILNGLWSRIQKRYQSVECRD